MKDLIDWEGQEYVNLSVEGMESAWKRLGGV